jgi:hypothetical protein
MAARSALVASTPPRPVRLVALTVHLATTLAEAPRIAMLAAVEPIPPGVRPTAALAQPEPSLLLLRQHALSVPWVLPRVPPASPPVLSAALDRWLLLLDRLTASLALRELFPTVQGPFVRTATPVPMLMALATLFAPSAVPESILLLPLVDAVPALPAKPPLARLAATSALTVLRDNTLLRARILATPARLAPSLTKVIAPIAPSAVLDTSVLLALPSVLLVPRAGTCQEKVRRLA